MDRSTFVLAAMSPAGGRRYSPVQIQKLMFLLDREISDLVGGPYFAFQPYHYGPFDKTVYAVLESLADQGHLDLDDRMVNRRSYALTPSGLEAGLAALGELDRRAQDFIRRSSEFVRKHTFSALVSAIYKKYPEMRQNSVFQH